jgi:hypothetical protein
MLWSETTFTDDKFIEQFKDDLLISKTRDDLMGKDGAVKTLCKISETNAQIRANRMHYCKEWFEATNTKRPSFSSR